MEPPAFGRGAPAVVRAAPGSAACLLVHAPAGTPPFEFHWSRAGAALDDRFTSSEDGGGIRLTVSAAQIGDSGVYTLQASNAAGSDTSRVRLEVSAEETPTGDDPPTFLRRLQDLTVKVGTRTRFLVEIISSTECKVTWYRNERRLLESERVSLARDGNFWCADVGAVSVDDAGRWTCSAENEGGRASCSAHLNVLVPKAYKRPEFVEELRALLTEQGTVSLECKVVGVPTPVLRWFKDSREIKAGDVFALTANAEDPTSLGTYTCEAVNCMGRAYSSSKVHVVGRGSGEAQRPASSDLSPEPPPIFTKELEDQSIKICDSLTLSCHVVVPPWPRSVVWYNKEGKVEPGERYHALEDGVGGYLLEVTSAEWADEGEWKCVATSAGGRVGISTCYVAMEVPKNYRKPRFMENLQAVLTEEGLVSFECKVVGFPTPVLSWFKDGQELKPGDVYQLTGTNSLGSYCCIARNCMGQASSSAELTVEDIQNQLNEEEKLQLFSKNQAPKFIQGLKSVEAKIDEPFKFTVKVAVPPEPSVVWYRDEQPVDESTRCHLGQEERGTFYLHIQSLEFLDQAEWKCVALNDFGHSVTSCFLKLIIPRHYKKPRFLENLQAILSEEGAVNLECKVIGVPQPVLKWYKDGEELKPGDIHRIISGQDGTCCLGTYTCEAQNCMGIAASSASLLGFEDSIKAKAKKAEEQALQRNLSLSTIHEERTSQMYDTPVGDITLDDKGEISFSFDGKEVSVSLYETPDLTEEEALQIVEMYADQLSENVTEHNVVELPPLRFVKETSTSGNLLMEAIIIDVSPDYFAVPEEDLRTEADVDDISIAEENGPPQLSLDQDIDIGGEDYLEKTMALLSDEKSDIPAKLGRKKSDSQKSVDDFYSLSRDQSLSEEKRDDDTHVSESDLISYESARSSAKAKSRSSKPSTADGQKSSEPTKTIIQKDETKLVKQVSIEEPGEAKVEKQESQEKPDGEKPLQALEVPVVKPKRERRTSRGSRRSSSGSEKSVGKTKEELLRLKADIEQLPIKPVMTAVEFEAKVTKVSDTLSKIINDVQLIERDIILKSELMSSAATASRSLEIISTLISPLSEIHSIADAAKESVAESNELTSSIFNSLPKPLKALHQSLTIVEKCIDMESDNKTLVKKTCVAFIETCGSAVQTMMTEITSIIAADYLKIENKVINEIDSLANEMTSVIKFSADTIQARNLLTEASDIKQEEPSMEEKHRKETQKVVFELKSPVNSLLNIIESAEKGDITELSKTTKSDVLLNDMSGSIQNLQTALEQVESLSISESSSSLQKYNTEIIEAVVGPILKLRGAFEQLSTENISLENEDNLKDVLSLIKNNLIDVSSQISTIEEKVGKFDILQSDNKLNVLQKMAQSLISLENNLPRLETMPEVHTHMNAFHKNLTKVLEIVIESNDSDKYFALLEICDAVNRINASIKLLEPDNALPLASLSNTLRIIQDHFVKNVFDTEINCSVMTSIADVIIGIQEAINKAEELSIKMESEHVQTIETPLPSMARVNIVLEHIDQTLAAIDSIKAIETTQDLKTALTPAFESINPILEELKKSVAAIRLNEDEKLESVSDLTIALIAQTLATPLCELNENIVVLNQILVENIESLKMQSSDVSSAIAEPLHELYTTLEILQQDVISQYEDNMTPYDVSVNMASAVQNLNSCILMIQEQAGIEATDEISTLEDISNIKTTADVLPSDRLVLPTAEETGIEQSLSPFETQLPVTATAQALQSLNEHLTILQNPEIIDALDTLSEVSDFSSLKSVVLSMEDLHNGIESILHPLPMEASDDLSGPTNIANLAAIAQPLQELQQSLSVLDTSNIPLNEDILDLPSDKVHEIIVKICEFKNQLHKCNEVILPAVSILDKSLEVSTSVATLRDVCSNLKSAIQSADMESYDIMTPEIIEIKEAAESVLKVTEPSKGIKLDEIKCITEKLYEKIIKAQEELIHFTSQPSTTLAQEAKLIEIVGEVEKNIAVLQQYDFIDLSRVSDMSPCISSHMAMEVESESLALLADIVENATMVVQDSGNDTPIADVIIVEDFFKTCKNEFTILRCLISKATSHKKIIRLLEEFVSLQTTITHFKAKRDELKLSDDVSGCLATFLLHADDCLETVQASLVKIVESQCDLLIQVPADKLKAIENLKETHDLNKNIVISAVIDKFVDMVQIWLPFAATVQNNVIQVLKQPHSPFTIKEEKLLVDKIEEFSDFLETQSKIEKLDDDSKYVIQKLENCLHKHQEIKDVSNNIKSLVILKCLSECADILSNNLCMDTEKKEVMPVKASDIALKDILTEMLQPLEVLQNQLANFREQVASGVDDSASFNITSTESLVQTMTEFHKEIVQHVETDNVTIAGEDIPLILEVDEVIQSIKEDIKSIENVEAARTIVEISEPINNIEKSLHSVLTSEMAATSKKTLTKEESDNLVHHIDHYIELIEIVEEISAIIKIENIDETFEIARDLKQSIASSQTNVIDDVCDQDIVKARNEQCHLAMKLQKALSVVQCQVMESAQELAPALGKDTLQRFAQVTTQLQTDLASVTGVQVNVQAPLPQLETKPDIILPATETENIAPVPLEHSETMDEAKTELRKADIPSERSEKITPEQSQILHLDDVVPTVEEQKQEVAHTMQEDRIAENDILTTSAELATSSESKILDTVLPTNELQKNEKPITATTKETDIMINETIIHHVEELISSDAFRKLSSVNELTCLKQGLEVAHELLRSVSNEENAENTELIFTSPSEVKENQVKLALELKNALSVLQEQSFEHLQTLAPTVEIESLKKVTEIVHDICSGLQVVVEAQPETKDSFDTIAKDKTVDSLTSDSKQDIDATLQSISSTHEQNVTDLAAVETIHDQAALSVASEQTYSVIALDMSNTLSEPEKDTTDNTMEPTSFDKPESKEVSTAHKKTEYEVPIKEDQTTIIEEKTTKYITSTSSIATQEILDSSSEPNKEATVQIIQPISLDSEIKEILTTGSVEPVTLETTAENIIDLPIKDDSTTVLEEKTDRDIASASSIVTQDVLQIASSKPEVEIIATTQASLLEIVHKEDICANISESKTMQPSTTEDSIPSEVNLITDTAEVTIKNVVSISCDQASDDMILPVTNVAIDEHSVAEITNITVKTADQEINATEETEVHLLEQPGLLSETEIGLQQADMSSETSAELVATTTHTMAAENVAIEQKQNSELTSIHHEEISSKVSQIVQEASSVQAISAAEITELLSSETSSEFQEMAASQNQILATAAQKELEVCDDKQENVKEKLIHDIEEFVSSEELKELSSTADLTGLNQGIVVAQEFLQSIAALQSDEITESATTPISEISLDQAKLAIELKNCISVLQEHSVEHLQELAPTLNKESVEKITNIVQNICSDLQIVINEHPEVKTMKQVGGQENNDELADSRTLESLSVEAVEKDHETHSIQPKSQEIEEKTLGVASGSKQLATEQDKLSDLQPPEMLYEKAEISFDSDQNIALTILATSVETDIVSSIPEIESTIMVESLKPDTIQPTDISVSVSQPVTLEHSTSESVSAEVTSSNATKTEDVIPKKSVTLPVQPVVEATTFEETAVQHSQMSAEFLQEKFVHDIEEFVASEELKELSSTANLTGLNQGIDVAHEFLKSIAALQSNETLDRDTTSISQASVDQAKLAIELRHCISVLQEHSVEHLQELAPSLSKESVEKVTSIVQNICSDLQIIINENPEIKTIEEIRDQETEAVQEKKDLPVDSSAVKKLSVESIEKDHETISIKSKSQQIEESTLQVASEQLTSDKQNISDSQLSDLLYDKKALRADSNQNKALPILGTSEETTISSSNLEKVDVVESSKPETVQSTEISYSSSQPETLTRTSEQISQPEVVTDDAKKGDQESSSETYEIPMKRLESTEDVIPTVEAALSKDKDVVLLSQATTSISPETHTLNTNDILTSSQNTVPATESNAILVYEQKSLNFDELSSKCVSTLTNQINQAAQENTEHAGIDLKRCEETVNYLSSVENLSETVNKNTFNTAEEFSDCISESGQSEAEELLPLTSTSKEVADSQQEITDVFEEYFDSPTLVDSVAPQEPKALLASEVAEVSVLENTLSTTNNYKNTELADKALSDTRSAAVINDITCSVLETNCEFDEQKNITENISKSSIVKLVATEVLDHMVHENITNLDNLETSVVANEVVSNPLPNVNMTLVDVTQNSMPPNNIEQLYIQANTMEENFSQTSNNCNKSDKNKNNEICSKSLEVPEQITNFAIDSSTLPVQIEEVEMADMKPEMNVLQQPDVSLEEPNELVMVENVMISQDTNENLKNDAQINNKKIQFLEKPAETLIARLEEYTSEELQILGYELLSSSHLEAYAESMHLANELHDCIELSLLGDEIYSKFSGGKYFLVYKLHNTLKGLEEILNQRKNISEISNKQRGEIFIRTLSLLKNEVATLLSLTTEIIEEITEKVGQLLELSSEANLPNDAIAIDNCNVPELDQQTLTRNISQDKNESAEICNTSVNEVDELLDVKANDLLKDQEEINNTDKEFVLVNDGMIIDEENVKIIVPTKQEQQRLVQHIDEFVAGDICEIVEEISNITNVETLKETVCIAKDLRDCLLQTDNTAVVEMTSPLTIHHKTDEAKLTRKLQNALSALHIQALESAELITPLIKPEMLQRVSEVITQLQEDLISAVELNLESYEIPQEMQPSPVNKLLTLLQEVNMYVNETTSVENNEKIESLRDTLDEVQTVIIKLKRDNDASRNDYLCETLDDLECSVRSVQLQINEDCPPVLLKEACETLEILVNTIHSSQEDVTETSELVASHTILESCSRETNETLNLLETASKLEPMKLSNMSIIIGNLNNLSSCLKSLRQSFLGDADTLIENGVEVILSLSNIENQVFELERDVDGEQSLSVTNKDIIIRAIHSVYSSISSMRSTITSIQKRYMYDNYGIPSEQLLQSIKNVGLITSGNMELNKTDWKKLSKTLRNVLNHFEDVKFYINLDKTARQPSDATFTKIILNELKTTIANVLMPQAMQLGPKTLVQVSKCVKCVEKQLIKMENQRNLEVKDKIPIFKEIASNIQCAISMIKTVMKEINQDISESALPQTNSEEAIYEKPSTSKEQLGVIKKAQPSVTEEVKGSSEEVINDIDKNEGTSKPDKNELAADGKIMEKKTLTQIVKPDDSKDQANKREEHIIEEPELSDKSTNTNKTKECEKDKFEQTQKDAEIEQKETDHKFNPTEETVENESVLKLKEELGIDVQVKGNEKEIKEQKATMAAEVEKKIAEQAKSDADVKHSEKEEKLSKLGEVEENVVSKEKQAIEVDKKETEISVKGNEIKEQEPQKAAEEEQTKAEETKRVADVMQKEEEEESKKLAEEQQNQEEFKQEAKLERIEKLAKETDERERSEKEKKIKEQEAKKAAEEKSNAEKEKRDAEVRQKEVEEKQNDEKAKQEAELKRKEELTKETEEKESSEKEKKTKEQKAKKAAEEKNKAEKEKRDAEVKQKEEEEKSKMMAEEQKKQNDEKVKQEVELKRKEELAKEVEEKERSEKEKKTKEQKAKKAAEEKTKAEKEKRDAEVKQKEEEEKSKKMAEEQKKQNDEKAEQEAELKRKEELAKEAEEKERSEKEKKIKEQEVRKAAEEKTKAEKEKRDAEVKQKEEEEKSKKMAEEQKKQNDEKAIQEAELKRKEELTKELEEKERSETEKKMKEQEAKKAAEENTEAEKEKLDAEVKQKEEEEKSKKMAEEQKKQNDEKAKQEAELKRKEELAKEVEEKERSKKEKKTKEQKAKNAAEEKTKAEKEKRDAEVEQKEEEEMSKKMAEEQKKQNDEKAEQEAELKRKEELAKEAEEKERPKKGKKIKEQEAKKAAEEKTKAEKEKLDAEVKQKEEEEKSKKMAEEQKKQNDEKAEQEAELKRKEELAKEAEEKERSEKEKKIKEQEVRKAAEEKTQAEKEKRDAEVKQKEEEEKSKKMAEEQKKQNDEKAEQEAELKRKEELAKEAEEKERSEKEKKIKEQEVRKAAEEKTKAEKEKRDAEVKQKEEEEKSKKMAEEQKKQNDEKAKQEAELKLKEELAKEAAEKERSEKEKKMKEQEAKKAAEEKTKAEKEKRDAEVKQKEEEEKSKKMAEEQKKQNDEKAKQEAELKRKEELAKELEEKERSETEKKMKEQEAQKAAEEKTKAEKEKLDAEVKQKEEEEKSKKMAEEQKKQNDEKAKQEAELKRKEELAKEAEEKERSEKEKKMKEQEAKKAAEEKTKAEKEKRDAEVKQKEEEEKSKKMAEEQKKQNDEKAKQEAELKRKEELAKEVEEKERSEKEKKTKEQKAKKAAEEKTKAEKEKRDAEVKQKEEEEKSKKMAEEQKKQNDEKAEQEAELKRKEELAKEAEEKERSDKEKKIKEQEVRKAAAEDQTKVERSKKDPEVKRKKKKEISNEITEHKIKTETEKIIATQDVNLKQKEKVSVKDAINKEDDNENKLSQSTKTSNAAMATKEKDKDINKTSNGMENITSAQKVSAVNLEREQTGSGKSKLIQDTKDDKWISQIIDREEKADFIELSSISQEHFDQNSVTKKGENGDIYHHKTSERVDSSQSYIKEYQYEPTSARIKDSKEKPTFVDRSHRDYTMDFARPSGYREKSFDVERSNESHSIYDLGKNVSIYKAQAIVLDSQLRSSASPYPDTSRSNESTHRKLEMRQRSKDHSEARSYSEKRSSVTRDSKRKPVFSTYLTDRTAVEGSRVKLTCSVLSSTDPAITWYKNGVIIDNKLKYRTKYVDGLITLEVLNAVTSDSAEYSCTVENENGSVSSSANLKVYPSFEASPIPPTFTRSIRDTYHMAENELVLECRIRGQPLPTITWLKDDKPVSSNERYQAYYLADGVCRLAIESPTPEDSGKYTCKAENSVWSDQITHVVTFTGKERCLSPNIATIEKSRFTRQAMESRRPHFTNVLTDYKVAKGGTIGLQVEIRGAPTNVEWLREGRSVTEVYRNAKTFVEQGLYTLALTDVTEKESGLYTCRAWSAHGNVDMNAAITVVQPNEMEGKPAIIVGRPEKDILISVGEDVNISFRVQGEPKPKVIFMKGIRDITTSQRVCKMTSDDYVKFTLKRSVISDAGTYCILARNAYGCDRAFVTVTVRQRASSDNLISDWTYPAEDSSISTSERNYKSVPARIPGEPSVVDGGTNWLSLTWSKPEAGAAAPVLAYRVDSWLLGKEGGARWVELGVTPLTTFDVFNLKQGEEYHFRVTPRNRYGFGESVQTSRPVAIGLSGDRPEFVDILPGQLKVLAGETANLSCSVKGKPTPEVVWMKNGHEIEESARVSVAFNGFDCGLTIRDICVEDEARYSCEASNVHGRSSTYARLAVVTDRMIWEADAKLKRERSAGAEGEFPPQFTMRLRDRRVQATYPVRLTCQVVGNPPPTVTWYKDGQEVEADSRRCKSQDEHFHTLEIAPTALEDGGMYEALARNSRGAVSCRCSLVVDKGIRAYVAPEFCCGLEPLYRLSDGEELRISAVVEAYPSVGVTWYRDGVRLRPSRRAVMTLDHDGQIELALAAVTPRDAGVYTCTASNEVGRASTSGKVEVIGGDMSSKTPPPVLLSPDVPYSKEPMFIRKPRSSTAREGDTVIIQCEVVGDPKPDVYWLRDFLKPDYYRDSSHFKRVGLGSEYRFEIPHAKLDYTGAYSVVARNVHGEAKAVISLQILAKDPTCTEESHNIRYGEVEVLPRFEKELTDLLSCDGDAVEFECRVSGHPEPDVKWYHYHELVRESDDFEWLYEDGTARLRIRQVTAEDEGTYTCEASNNLGKTTSSACLVVYPAGEPNTLCQRLRRPPALLSACSTPRSTPRTTPARSVSRARTPGPDTRRLCSPARQMAPTFYTYPFNKVAEEGDTVTLQCAVKGLPAPWATWDKDGVIITPSSRITIKEKDEILRILEIEQVTAEDVGVYRITVENEYGRAEASARIEVITQRGKFYGGVRAYSPSPRRSMAYRRRPSTPRQD